MQQALDALRQSIHQEQNARQQAEHRLQQLQVLSTLKVPKPPETDGVKPTPEHFCEAIETYFEQKGVDVNTPAACAFVATFLRDAAMSWYTQHRLDVQSGVAAPFSSWAEMKAAFLAHFSPYDVQEVARSKLDKLTQTRSVADYSRQFGALMLQLPQMDTGTRIHHYLSGLKPFVRSWVATHQPKTLENAISMAVATDTMLYSSGMAAGNPFSGSSSGVGSSSGRRGAQPGSSKQFGGSGSYGRYHGSTPMELGAMQRQAPRFKQQSGGSEPYCSFHKSHTHWTRDCRQRAQYMQSQHATGNAGKP
jgi:hypothetical protein